MDKTNLGDRIKENYENRSKTYLIRRMPVMLRLDGMHFHTFTKGFDKPFDYAMMEAMKQTMKYLVENIQGCVFGYTQSDEITLVLIDYQNLDTSAWFDYSVQKMCSAAASLATWKFNDAFRHTSYDCIKMGCDEKVMKAHEKINNGAFFDCRAFNVPKEEVANAILFRQNDAKRNSIFSLANSHFSYKQLKGLKSAEQKELLLREKGINWDELTNDKKWGSCAYRVTTWRDDENGESVVASSAVVIDNEMPMILGEDRNLVEQFIFVGE